MIAPRGNPNTRRRRVRTGLHPGKRFKPSILTDLRQIFNPTRHPASNKRPTNRPASARAMPSPQKLGDLDSNQNKQNQNLLCYRYTIPQVAPYRNRLLFPRAALQITSATQSGPSLYPIVVQRSNPLPTARHRFPHRPYFQPPHHFPPKPCTRPLGAFPPQLLFHTPRLGCGHRRPL